MMAWRLPGGLSIREVSWCGPGLGPHQQSGDGDYLAVSVHRNGFPVPSVGSHFPLIRVSSQ